MFSFMSKSSGASKLWPNMKNKLLPVVVWFIVAALLRSNDKTWKQSSLLKLQCNGKNRKNRAMIFRIRKKFH